MPRKRPILTHGLELSTRAESLKANSKEYLKVSDCAALWHAHCLQDTKNLAWQLTLRKYAPFAALIFMVLLFLYAWLYI